MSRRNRHLLLALLICSGIVISRSYFISRAHSECVDDEYHLIRGVAFWTGNLNKMRLNDPPLGEALGALPLVLSGVRFVPGQFPLYGQSLCPETLLTLIAVWKSILFIPLIALAFICLRDIYNTPAAWIGALLLSVEPNFAAFIPSAAIDVIAVEGIVFACYFGWKYFEKPSIARLIALSTSTAVAMLLKHTAIITPIVVAVFGAVWWLRKKKSLRFGTLISHAALGFVIFLVGIWAFTGFNVGRPFVTKELAKSDKFAARLSSYRFPAGQYVGSLLNGSAHAERGHRAYLLGERSMSGWWYYFPVVATYKVPISVAAIGLLALISLMIVRPRFEELALLIPCLAWTIFLMQSRISIGFRHFLPGYAFMLLLIARIGAGNLQLRILGFGLVFATTIDSTRFHPDYLSYINFPHGPASYLAISDSNIDWGQSLKQVRAWLDAHPQQNRTVSLGYFGRPEEPNVAHYLDDRVVPLKADDPPPKQGLLILSPVWLVGAYDKESRYGYLRNERPLDRIGNCMLVFDLDHLRQRD